MQLVRRRNPRVEPRRCSSPPLIASVGPLEVVGPVEVGQHVSGAPGEGAAELGDLDQRFWERPRRSRRSA